MAVTKLGALTEVELTMGLAVITAAGLLARETAWKAAATVAVTAGSAGAGADMRMKGWTAGVSSSESKPQGELRACDATL